MNISSQNTYVYTFFSILIFLIKLKRIESSNGQRLMKLIWLPPGQQPPTHIPTENLQDPSSQLPYINVSPSRAPKQLLGARYKIISYYVQS